MRVFKNTVILGGNKMQKKRIISFALAILFLLTGCNNSTSKGEVKSSNKISLQLESNHFKFYSKDQDKKCLEDLSKALEENYTRITNDLITKSIKNVDVYVYSDLDTYHKEINQPDAPTWVVGNAGPEPNTIKMANPLNVDGPSYSNFMKIIVHEFTHVVVSNINPNASNIPIWLNEGIATYESKQFSKADMTNYKDKLGKYPLKDLETDFLAFGNNNGYIISYCIVEYIIKTYGYDKLIDSIKTPSDMEKIFGVSKEDFQNSFIFYINNNY